MNYKSSMTDVGNEMIAQAHKDDKAIIFDSFLVSEALSDTGVELTKTTKNLFSNPLTYPINSKATSDNTFTVKAVLANKTDKFTVDEDFSINVIGVLAHIDGSSDSRLITIAVAEGTGAVITAFRDTLYSLTVAITQAYKADQPANFGLANVAYALADDLDKLKTDIQIIIDGGLTNVAKINEENTFTEVQKFDKGATDGKGNAYATTKDVATGLNNGLSTKVNVSDMRKPASDVAGIEEVNAKQDKIGYTPADDSKVLHSSIISQPSGTDLNTMKTAGFFQVPNGLNTAPNSDNWTIYQIIRISQFNGVQIAYNTNNGMLAIRSWHSVVGVVFSSWVTFADDSKVAHLSGANNFDTVPTVKNNPLLLANSLPSDLARTSQQTNFTAGLQSNGQDVVTVKTPGIPKLAVKYNATSKAFDYTLTAPEKDGFSDIIQYNLLWKDHSVDDWTTVVVNPDALTGQLTGVDIPKTYDFKASAKNAVGSSDFTDVITLVTVDGNIYGASWDGSSSGVLQRTDAAVGLKAGINGAQNDFDSVGPWAKMDKTVTDENGNEFVRIPKLYIKKIQDSGSATWQVSLNKADDTWYLPKCFWDFDSNKELDYVDVGRYQGTITSGKLQSKSGVQATSNQTIGTFRADAKANGTGYQLLDIHVIDVLQVLFIIEFATLDSQSIMHGLEGGGGAQSVNGTGTNHTGSSGYATATGPMDYRGVENMYGNLYQWADGVNFNGAIPWVCDDSTKYQSDLFSSPYQKLNYTTAGNGYISKMGYDSGHPFAQFATAASGSSTTYYADYQYTTTGNAVAAYGGYWNGSAGYGGAFYWVLSNTSTGADAGYGSRLVKKALG